MIDISNLPEAEQAELQKLLEIHYAHISPFNDAWDFLSRAVFTRDEADGSIKRFPANVMWEGELRFEYLRYLTEERDNYKIRVYDKSRRMMITWWLVAIYLYELMTKPNEKSAVASDKLAKSAYLLGKERMQFIYDHIPPLSDQQIDIMRTLVDDVEPFRERVWPEKPVVIFEHKESEGWQFARCESTNSSIMAVASGESQMQQYTFSKILADEFPRWERQRESWRNMQPTLQGGGTMDIPMTPELGSFAGDLIFDRAV